MDLNNLEKAMRNIARLSMDKSDSEVEELMVHHNFGSDHIKTMMTLRKEIRQEVINYENKEQ